MFARFGIRIVASLVGIAAGIILSVALLSGFSASVTSIVVATLLFWVVHIVVQFIALKMFLKEPSVSFALLLALASTLVALVIVNLVVSDVRISGVGTYLAAAIIIWICTAIADVLGTRKIRARRFS
jgi:hypothetical protein